MQKKKKRDVKDKGNSKYARKIAKRRQLAIKLELSADTPYPVIWANS